MRIFITGGNGQLAQSIREVYQDQEDTLFFASKDTLDILDEKNVEDQIMAFKPDVIFHFASMTRGDDCFNRPDEAHKVNVIGTKNIAAASEKANATLLFVSTNEVFDGNKKEKYTENDIPNPITVVGKTKYEAEKIISSYLKKFYIIRTSWLYSNWSKNFLHAVLKKVITDKKISLVHDEIGSPTYSYDLAEAIKKLTKTERYGIYHLVNEGEVSRLDFAKKAFEIYNLKGIEILPVSLDQFARLSKPPRFSALKSTDTTHIGFSMPKWDDALRRFLKKHNIISAL